MPELLIIGVLTAAASWWATGRARRYALDRAMLDVPNHRSSHVVPTPRGGGLAVVATVLGGTAVGALLGIVPPRLAASLLGGGSLVALAGWLDDRSATPARTRFAMHLAAAIWSVAWAGGYFTFSFGPWEVAPGPLGSLLAVLGIVWVINLYNFMDGIDGIAGGEAVSVGGVAVLLLIATGHTAPALLALLLTAGSAGFLLWNWAPAKIFMGDVGSGFIGFTFGVLALETSAAGTAPLDVWLILLAVFFGDATATLLRRIFRGERWYTAHRSHAYQRAVEHGWSHARVSSAVVVANVGLGVLAAAALARPDWALPALAIAYGLIAAAYLAVERVRPMSRHRQVTGAGGA